MKSALSVVLLGLAATLAGSGLSLPRHDPLWEGPTPIPNWVGLSVEEASRAQKSDEVDLAGPSLQFLGYFKRGGVWQIRLGSPGGVETLQKGQVSAEGWELVEIIQAHGKISSIQLSRSGETLELPLTL